MQVVNQFPAKRVWLWGTAWGLVLAGCAVYANSFAGVFLFDDIPHLVRSDLTVYLWPDLALWHSRGVVMWTFGVNEAMHGKDVWGYHLVNLLIHLVNGLLVWRILTFTLSQAGYGPRRSHWLAATVALLFLVHPLQTNAVTYLVQRMEALMSLWLLLTLGCVIQRTRTGRSFWTVLAMTCCLLGMRSKEVMIAAPLVLIWYDWVILQPLRRMQTAASERPEQAGDVAGPAAVAPLSPWLLYGGLLATTLANPAWAPVLSSFASSETTGVAAEKSTAFVVPGITRWEYFRTQPQVIWKYVELVFWPADLCLDRGWPVEQDWAGILLPGLPLAVLLALSLWGLWKRHPLSLLGGWFFLILAPTSSVIPFQDLYFEHRMYLAMLSVVLATVLTGDWLGDRLLSSMHGRPAYQRAIRWGTSALLGLIVVSLGMTTSLRNTVYHNQLIMWEDCVRKAPGHARAHYSLGHYIEQNQLEALYPLALKHHQIAVELDSSESAHWNGLAMINKRLGQKAAELRSLEEALELDPDSPYPLLNLGNYFFVDDLERSKDYFERALAILPDHPDGNNNYGMILRRLGRDHAAAEHFRKALRKNPQLWPAQLNLADVTVENNPAEALRLYREVPFEHYDSPGVFNSLARTILRVERNIPAAVAVWRKGVEFFPEHADAWFMLAESYLTLEAYPEAARILDAARKRFPADPRFPELINELSTRTSTSETPSPPDFPSQRAVR